MLVIEDDSCFPLVDSLNYGFYHTSLGSGGSGKQELNKRKKGKLDALNITVIILKRSLYLFAQLRPCNC